VSAAECAHHSLHLLPRKTPLVLDGSPLGHISGQLVSQSAQGTTKLPVVICPQAHSENCHTACQRASQIGSKMCHRAIRNPGSSPLIDTSRIPIPHISRSFTRPTERRLKTPSWLDSHCNLRRSRPRPIHSPRPTQPSSARQTICTLLLSMHLLLQVKPRGVSYRWGTSPNGRFRPAAFSHCPGTVLHGWRMCERVIAGGQLRRQPSPQEGKLRKKRRVLRTYWTMVRPSLKDPDPTLCVVCLPACLPTPNTPFAVIFAATYTSRYRTDLPIRGQICTLIT
jgi:hypothetical protein